MALGSHRVCDVYGTTNKVKSYLVEICEVTEDGQRGTKVYRRNKDLCPKALDRLMNFSERGVNPPTAKTETSAAPGHPMALSSLRAENQ